MYDMNKITYSSAEYRLHLLAKMAVYQRKVQKWLDEQENCSNPTDSESCTDFAVWYAKCARGCAQAIAQEQALQRRLRSYEVAATV